MKIGDPMQRVDDGMRGIVAELNMVEAPGLVELRIVYTDRGERRVAGKREKWEPVTAPPRKLRAEEIRSVATIADRLLCAFDLNMPSKWWEWGTTGSDGVDHDPELVRVITEHLSKRA